MKRFFSKKFLRGLKIFLVIYFLAGAALYFFQEKLLFHPEKLPVNYRFEFNAPFKQVDVPLDDETNLSIVQFTVPDSLQKGVVLYFHGNKGNINRYAPFAAHFIRNHYEAWMIDYPGFGKTTGNISEERLYADALTLYKMARSQYSTDSIVIYGKSIGTGIATQLAAIRDCRQLILETPYYSTHSLARRFFPVYPSLLKYDLKTAAHLDKIKIPVTILHGTADWTVPYGESKKIFKEHPQVNLISFKDGEHNNLHTYPKFQQVIDSLLAY